MVADADAIGAADGVAPAAVGAAGEAAGLLPGCCWCWEVPVGAGCGWALGAWGAADGR